MLQLDAGGLSEPNNGEHQDLSTTIPRLSRPVVTTAWTYHNRNDANKISKQYSLNKRLQKWQEWRNWFMRSLRSQHTGTATMKVILLYNSKFLQVGGGGRNEEYITLMYIFHTKQVGSLVTKGKSP